MTPTTQPDSQAGDDVNKQYFIELMSILNDRLDNRIPNKLPNMLLAWRNSYAERLATRREHEARLNELKHRADDIINRMYRLDREYADKYIATLTEGKAGQA
jgi:hypothetical protein